MATRDRTEEFIQLRGFKRSKRGDTEKLLGGAEEEMRAVPVAPRWVLKMEDIRVVERQVSTKLQELENLHKEHLKVQFGTTRDEEQEERDIERMANHISKLFQQLEQGVKDLDIIFKAELGDDGGSQAELSILRNVKMCLVNEIEAISRVFRDSQRRYLREMQKQKGVRDRWAGGERQKNVQQQLERDAMMDSYLQKGMTQDQMEMIMVNQRMAEDREKEFLEIYNSIKALHEMFKDMHTLVIEQGTVLDRVDYNMTLAHDKVTKARKELEQAAKIQSAGRFKLCVLFLVVMILGFTIALLFKLSG